MAERLKVPLSKSGILAKTGIVGSNPTLSAMDAASSLFLRRDVRVAEGARLEIVYVVNSGIVGSTPTLSAISFPDRHR